MAKEKYGISVDIGTTTIAAALITEDGRIIKEIQEANAGCSAGADVMSRIRAAVSGAAGELRALLQADLTRMITQLSDPSGQRTDAAYPVIVLSGNTTMLHLLNGYDCTGLSRYPYTPVSLSREEHAAGELFPDLPPCLHDARVLLLPGISAFVGADIVSGLYALGLLKAPLSGDALFLDLGTNGEMAHISEENGERRFTVCSTAAGPVFEGAGIRFGMRGAPGAIADVVLLPDKERGVTARIRTVDNAPPVGICGSGVLEIVSELARLHLIDASGLLCEPWFTEGVPLAMRENGTEIRFFQEDVRAVQLAKAAIRAGAEVLPIASGKSRRDIETVYVAGAFGTALNFSRLGPLGLFPEDLTDRCLAAGNTSLKGAVRAAAGILSGEEDAVFMELDSITAAAHELPLAGRRDFEACYTSMMGFRV